jgi:glycine betaine/proline transport system ATP-binding protein
MNPLNVLKGGTVMRPRAALHGANGTLLLDPHGRYAVTLDGGGSAASASCGGATLPLLRLNGYQGNGALPPGIVLAPRETPLRQVVQLRQASGHPVLLEDGAVFAGVCDDAEMLAALSGVGRTVA